MAQVTLDALQLEGPWLQLKNCKPWQFWVITHLSIHCLMKPSGSCVTYCTWYWVSRWQCYFSRFSMLWIVFINIIQSIIKAVLRQKKLCELFGMLDKFTNDKMMAAGTNKRREIDGGYAWVIAFAFFMWNVIVNQYYSSVGIMHIHLEDLFQQGAFKTSLVASFFTLSLGLLSPLAGYMCDRYTRRSIIMLNGLLLSGLFKDLLFHAYAIILHVLASEAPANEKCHQTYVFPCSARVMGNVHPAMHLSVHQSIHWLSREYTCACCGIFSQTAQSPSPCHSCNPN